MSGETIGRSREALRNGETALTKSQELMLSVRLRGIETGFASRSAIVVSTANYNQVLRIEEALRPDARYWGLRALLRTPSGLSQASW